MANLDPTGFLTDHISDIRGISWKYPVACATTANITLSGTQTIDGHAAVAGERVLVKDQTTGSQNGIWVVAAGAWARAWDMDQDATTAVVSEETLGAVVEVLIGTVNGGTFWRCSNTSTPVLGTTALTFVQFAAGATLTIKDEGSALATAATSIDFVGAGVTASGTGAAKTVTIPGGATALAGLTDVVITSAAVADRLRFDGSVWRNSNLVWEPMIASDGSVMTDGSLNPMQSEVPY